MTVYGYVRVKPDAVAGTLNRHVWWLEFSTGCKPIYFDVWIGDHDSPGLDHLLDDVVPGDVVVVRHRSQFGTSRARQEAVLDWFTCRGVRVSEVGGSPPPVGGPIPPIQIRMTG